MSNAVLDELFISPHSSLEEKKVGSVLGSLGIPITDDIRQEFFDRLSHTDFSVCDVCDTILDAGRDLLWLESLTDEDEEVLHEQAERLVPQGIVAICFPCSINDSPIV